MMYLVSYFFTWYITSLLVEKEIDTCIYIYPELSTGLTEYCYAIIMEYYVVSVCRHWVESKWKNN